MRAFVPSPQTPNGPWSLILQSVRYLILRSISFIVIQEYLKAFLPKGVSVWKK